MDRKVAVFIRDLPSDWGYARLAEACRAAFGEAAPDADAIRAWWLTEGRPTWAPGRLRHDAEVAAAIRDLAGRRTAADILREIRARFPAARVPSRTAFYRYHARICTDHARP